jgi:probable HAF family extracellular repeat protein
MDLALTLARSLTISLSVPGGRPMPLIHFPRRSPRRKRLTRLTGPEQLEMRSLLSSYTVTNLGTFGGPVSFALGISNVGEVVGGADTKRYYWGSDGGKSYYADAFLWKPSAPNGTKGSLTDLGTLGSFDSEAHAINGFGQVVGWADLITGTDSFLWTPSTPNGTSGSMIDLGSLGGSSTSARAINGIGQVVGYSAGHAFLWNPTTPNGTSGSMIDLGTFGGTRSGARAINTSGQILGSYQAVDGVDHGFLWTPTTPNGTSGSILDLGPAPASCMNDSGEIVGLIGSDLGLYVGGQTYDLGSLYTGITRVDAINGAGQIVGTTHLSSGADHAFLWTPTTPNGTSGSMIDLDTLVGSKSFTPEEATGINDQCQIAGFGMKSGTAFAFLLTPTKTTTTALPQPADGPVATPSPSLIDPRARAATSFAMAGIVAPGEAGLGTWDRSNPAPDQAAAPMAADRILDLALALLGGRPRRRAIVNDRIAHPIQAYPLIS